MPDATSGDFLPTIWGPWMGEDTRVVRIPVTTPTKYVSYEAALNLRLPGEETGDWHGDVPFLTAVDNPWTLSLAGPGCRADTTPSLGSRGVRDMAHILQGEYIPEGCGPVWVANHYRAIADYVCIDTTGCWCSKYPRHAPVYTINQWLDTPEQINHLVEEYLKPLRAQFTPEEKEVHDEWLPTVVWP